jgi:dimethylhistidine N-methyltransferase
LHQYADELAGHFDGDVMLIELGSGASRKVRILLDELQPQAYMAIDISRDFLLQEAGKLATDYPGLAVHALCADLCEPLQLEGVDKGYQRLAYFPGSSIGNFEPAEAQEFLGNLRSVLNAHDRLLVGVDMKKDRHLLDAAYNDAAGITAQFNLNILHRIQRELDTDLEADNFRHLAFYDDARGRVEMHLVSEINQIIRIEDQVIHFDADERIHTECSYKYHPAEFRGLAHRAGYAALEVWTDDAQLFSLHLLQPR